jgi:hypothetical protein
MNMTEPMANYARGIVGFLIDVRGIAPDDLEPEVVTDAMIRGAADEAFVWQEREQCWNDSCRIAAQVLGEMGR